ncbi:proline-rich protein 2-like [Diceros bicornis minor]|uniref:proline-rich protein 2-like n=1 Tax=Diceros bicornis minor TaxID=77932 RepID=UPI0026F1E7D3|nr:proline-rich protein 2-like [Diceros bicornis minor]
MAGEPDRALATPVHGGLGGEPPGKGLGRAQHPPQTPTRPRGRERVTTAWAASPLAPSHSAPPGPASCEGARVHTGLCGRDVPSPAPPPGQTLPHERGCARTPPPRPATGPAAPAQVRREGRPGEAAPGGAARADPAGPARPPLGRAPPRSSRGRGPYLARCAGSRDNGSRSRPPPSGLAVRSVRRPLPAAARPPRPDSRARPRPARRARARAGLPGQHLGAGRPHPAAPAFRRPPPPPPRRAPARPAARRPPRPRPRARTPRRPSVHRGLEGPAPDP